MYIGGFLYYPPYKGSIMNGFTLAEIFISKLGVLTD